MSNSCLTMGTLTKPHSHVSFSPPTQYQQITEVIVEEKIILILVLRLFATIREDFCFSLLATPNEITFG